MKKHDMKPIEKLFGQSTETLTGLLKDIPTEIKPPTVEYLSKIQNDQKDLGARLKAVRENNCIRLEDIANKEDAERIERGNFTDRSGQPITARYLMQYAHEIGAKLSCFNVTE